MTEVLAAIGGLVVLVLLILGFAGLKVVREYQRLVVFRLGRTSGTKGPGLILINPITDRVSWVDLREQYLEIPHQTAITRDNASISIDFIIFFKVFDSLMSVLEVNDFKGAALNIAATTLRSVVGDMTLDDVLSKREDMNGLLRVKLDEVTERWGVKVTNVEVREINPPPMVQEAMTRQMSAERTRRAVVTEADGQKQASITVAEGDKQSAILSAEGDRQAAILRAEGFALALAKVSEVAKGIDGKTMTLQYLDALKELGASDSTKFVLPLELTNLVAGLTGGAQAAMTAAATPTASALGPAEPDNGSAPARRSPRRPTGG
ncbi:MAG TPA: SPFH domain-containing protein [Acidimicrobiales bacterium]|nr:SPFH domain-containing protein [Acidimicrobiales bacterium]